MTKPFEWIHDLPSGLSVTELEIRQALHLEKPMLMLVRNDKRDADTMLVNFSLWNQKAKDS